MLQILDTVGSALARHQPVYTFDVPGNRALLDAGAQAVSPSSLAATFNAENGEA